MKRLVGGDFLLDLPPVVLEKSESVEDETEITNENVLEQLSSLKTFIQNPKMIKPVWVKLNYEGLIAIRGEAIHAGASEIDIVVKTKYYVLTLYVTFVRVTLEDDTPIDDWKINEASYNFTSNFQQINATLNDYLDADNIEYVIGFNSNGDLSKTEFTESGTKLFHHHMVDAYEKEINVVSNMETFDLTTSDGRLVAENNINMFGGYFYDGVNDYYGRILNIAVASNQFTIDYYDANSQTIKTTTLTIDDHYEDEVIPL